MLLQRSPKAVVAIGITILAAAGVAALLAFDPNSPDNPLPRCVFHLLTGLYCPGCGMTRALHALLRGEVATAWSMNPMVLAMLAIAPAMAWHALDRRPAMPAPVSRALTDGRWWIGALVSFGVLRNLPWGPFAWMAPG